MHGELMLTSLLSMVGRALLDCFMVLIDVNIKYLHYVHCLLV